jgi:hypothetical protein
MSQSTATGENLPHILKSFLSDVYDLNFPAAMEDKIAVETKAALNKVLLDNMDFFEQYNQNSNPEVQNT